MLREVTAHHLAALRTKEAIAPGAHLEAARPATGQLLQQLRTVFAADGVAFSTSRRARCNEHERCSVGDFVLALLGTDQLLGIVEVHCAVDEPSEVITGLRLCAVVSESARAWTARRSDDLRFVPAAAVQCALTWAGSGSVVKILKPHRL